MTRRLHRRSHPVGPPLPCRSADDSEPARRQARTARVIGASGRVLLDGGKAYEETSELPIALIGRPLLRNLNLGQQTRARHRLRIELAVNDRDSRDQSARRRGIGEPMARLTRVNSACELVAEHGPKPDSSGRGRQGPRHPRAHPEGLTAALQFPSGHPNSDLHTRKCAKEAPDALSRSD
jgi:hypothetical protein